MNTPEILSSFGIRLRSSHPGNHKTICPRCSHTRKHKRDPCLSVMIERDGVVFNCHNCGHAGGRRHDRNRCLSRAGTDRVSAPSRHAGTVSSKASPSNEEIKGCGNRLQDIPCGRLSTERREEIIALCTEEADQLDLHGRERLPKIEACKASHGLEATAISEPPARHLATPPSKQSQVVSFDRCIPSNSYGYNEPECNTMFVCHISGTADNDSFHYRCATPQDRRSFCSASCGD